MVEISLSGSGEGPGKVTTRGYSTISRCWRFFSQKIGPWEVTWEVSRGRFFVERAFCGRLSSGGLDLASAQVASPKILTAFRLDANR